MKVVHTDLCGHCKTIDYTEHFFFHCKKAKILWLEVEKLIYTYTQKKIQITEKVALIGIGKDEMPNKRLRCFINHAILVAKLSISKFKYGKKYNILTIFNNEAHIRQLWKIQEHARV